MSIEEKPACSEAKQRANRENARKSTGPKSVEGKNRSRLNAMTHGFCATKVEIPDEDPQAIIEREIEWQAELNPEARAVQGYLIHAVVRQTVKLDRIHESSRATASKRVRDAHKVDHENKMREIDLLKEMLLTEQCPMAVRRLMTTSEGCAYLIHEWTILRPTLGLPFSYGAATWDDDDLKRLNQLTGNDSAVRQIAPSMYILETVAIKAHRDVAIRLKANEHPERYAQRLRYVTPSDRVRDEEDLPVVKAKAEPARLSLLKVLEDHLAMLTDLKRKLDAEADTHPDEVPYRAIFDSSDEEKLIHRYEMENERSLMRCFKEIRELNKADVSPAQPVVVTSFKDLYGPPAPPRSTPPPARNEPTEPGPGPAFGGLFAALKRPQVDVPINITPPDWDKRKE